MQVHGYNAFGDISATIDGTLFCVPDDPGNRHRQLIAEWEAEGNTIPPYQPAPVAPPAITRRQMLLGLLSIGITEAMVEAEIAEICDPVADPVEHAGLMIEWRAAGTIERDHPLVADLSVAFALPAEQVDALWIWASAL
ncbi:hypothetical protein SAMN05892877_13223 [Rhizobium subbaraonis]|uniref:Uncharacterized protein n=1 Tax=Rhizobium subbaraonis TaxID=908946 RepID=A0A285V265_9HYPH|nr:hypothetical protein [Rhizobium subbaraonis]SOC47678.1 hypothetical protein SAMN05892877_13223 [Rhizobium subbaraonis]